MGFFDSMKSNQLGTRAYRTHVAAQQLRRQGKYHEAEAKLDEAFKMYGEAYALGFRKGSAILGYAILTMQRGDLARARELMLECSKDKTLSAEDRLTLRINFSVCQWKMGNVDKAIETIRTAANGKMSGMIYSTLGMYLVDKARITGDFEEAIAFNKEAMEYDDEDAATLDNMGQMYLAMSERASGAEAAELLDKAYTYFDKAHKEKAEQITSRYYLAKLEMDRGNEERARKLLDGALKLPMTALCPVSRSDLENLRAKLG